MLKCIKAQSFISSTKSSNGGLFLVDSIHMEVDVNSVRRIRITRGISISIVESCDEIN